ncbi:MAG: flippase-like domain-containing protein [Chloroflexi bacterium]|nr:flippase-like domain-containing protein [Chloroflexota bacterium]
MQSNRRFNVVWNILKILVAAALVWVLLSKTDLDQFLALRGRILLPYLVATLILYICLTLLKAFKYHLLIQQRTEYLRVLNIVVMQNALSNFFSNSAGAASYLALLKIEEKVKMGRSGLVFMITKIGDLFAVWIVMIFCSLLLWDRIVALQKIVLLLGLVVGIGFVVFFVAMFWRRWFINILSRLLTRLRLTRFSFVEQIIQALDAFAEMEQNAVFSTVFIAFGLSFLYYLLTLAWMVVSMRVFSLQVETLVIVFVSGILQLYSLVPITVFGGLGVTEVTSLYLYSLFGVDHGDLSVVLVGWRVLYYLTNLVVLIYMPVYAVFIERRLKSK